MSVNLRIPGPTPIPDQVLEASSRQMVNHRGPEFQELLVRLTKKLQDMFETKNDMFILTASGTGAMEAAIVNTISPGEKVLGATVGVFGTRFTQIAKAYGADVTEVTAPFGQALDPEDIRKALKADPSITTVYTTHNETSTGVTNDLAGIAQVVKGEFGKLLLVDAISSIGSVPCPVDEWDLDVVASGSQKGWMAPPGLAMISFSAKAWEAAATAKTPRFYFDLEAAKRYLEQREQTPWTPAVSVAYAMDTSLDMLQEEGLANVHERHARVAQVCRDGIRGLGLELFADEAVASNTVTAVKVPDGVEGSKLVGLMRTEYDVVLAGGQASLEGKIFRVGHLGYCSEDDIRGVIGALESALPRVGFQPARIGSSAGGA